MKNFLKEAAKHTVIFGMGDIAQKMVGFFLLPVYMARLTPEDYGVLAMMGVVSMLFGNLIAQGIPIACLRFYSTEFPRGEKGAHNSVLSTALVYMFAASGIYYGMLIFLAPKLNGLFFKEGDFTRFLVLVFITDFFRTTSNIPFIVLRARLLSAVASVIALVRVTLGTLLIIWFVVVLDMKVEGVIIANLIMAGLVFLGAPLIPLIVHRKPPLEVSLLRLREMLAFGLPFVPGAFAMWILSSTDRYFLEHFSSRAELGLYSLGFTFASIISVVFLGPFRMTWPGLMLPKSLEADAKETFARFATYFLFLGALLGLPIILGSEYVIRIMGPPEYWRAYSVVPVLVVSIVVGTEGLQAILNTGIFIEKKTSYAPLIVIVGAVCNVLLNLALIPRFGMMGASVATLMSGMVMVWVTVRINQRFYPIPYEYGRIAHLGAVFILVVFLNYIANPESIWLAIPVKTGLLALFLMFLFATGFFTEGEKNAAKEAIRRYVPFLGIFQSEGGR